MSVDFELKNLACLVKKVDLTKNNNLNHDLGNAKNFTHVGMRIMEEDAWENALGTPRP